MERTWPEFSGGDLQRFVMGVFLFPLLEEQIHIKCPLERTNERQSNRPKHRILVPTKTKKNKKVERKSEIQIISNSISNFIFAAFDLFCLLSKILITARSMGNVFDVCFAFVWALLVFGFLREAIHSHFEGKDSAASKAFLLLINGHSSFIKHMGPAMDIHQ